MGDNLLNRSDVVKFLFGLKLASKELQGEHFDEEGLEENVYVAENEEEKVIGYVSFPKGESEWTGPHYELEHIVVAAKFRGSKVGRMLFNIVFEKAKKGKANITAEALARNKEALKFYEELGFEPPSVGLVLDLQKRLPKK